MKLKNFLTTTFALIAMAVMLTIPTIEKASAQGQAGTGVRVVFGATNVGTSTWVPVVASLSRSITGIVISNTSAVDLYLGTISSGATANTEVQRMLIPGSSAATFYPLQVSAGWRVSIKAITSTASAGYGNFSFFYQ